MGIWYVVQTSPGVEKIARDHIKRRGFEALAPSWLHRGRQSGGKRERFSREKLWLPRYVLVRGGHEMWTLIDRMTIIHGVLSPHGYPLAIPQSAIDWLMANDGRVFDQETERHRAICINDLVKVASGPFCGQTVKVAFIKGKTVSVPMKVLGADRIVKFPLDQLEVA